ncbi:MAG: redoxin domain-containing protein, partial [Bacteroidetes bacterium]|nr:redoxin domain-containing protein [Bacteroidota bacterium]
MNKKILLVITFACLNTANFAQQIKIDITNTVSTKAALFSLNGERFSFVDSIFTSAPGKFNYSDKNLIHGFYRLSFDVQKSITLLHDGEEVEITANAENISESIHIVTSVSNKFYFKFLNLSKSYKTKTELLQLILARYPKDDDYYKITQEKFVQLQKEYSEFVENSIKSNPNSFIARYITSAQLPIVDFNLTLEKQLLFLKTHALDNVDFDDAQLIYSDAFTNKTIEYLTYYRNPQLPLELLEKEFMSAIDSILNKAKVNQIVYQHIVEYLIDGFKKFGFDKVIDYIVENYVIKDDLCLDAKTESSIQRRIDQSKKLSVGVVVPNIKLQSADGKEIDLSKIKSEKVLIIFYASWCPHCQTLLPQIFGLYNSQKVRKTEVLAISIDTSKADWLNFIKTYNLNWLNVSDLMGWEGKAATDYFI